MILLSCIGIVWIIKDSYIFARPRNFLSSKSDLLKELLSCSLCLGFWCGLVIGLINLWIGESISLKLLLLPLSSAAFCWFSDSLLDLIQESIVSLKNKNT